MLGRIVAILDRSLGLAKVSRREEALAEERFRALGRQVPWLYAILLVNLTGAEDVIRRACQALDKAAQKGVVHRNNAARRKSRLHKAFNRARAAATEA